MRRAYRLWPCDGYTSGYRAGRLRPIATVEDPAVVSKILAHRGLLHPADAPGPAPPSAALRPAAPSRP